MSRFKLLIVAAAAALIASPSFAQTAPADPASQPADTAAPAQPDAVPGSRVIRMEYDDTGITPDTTVGSEQLEMWTSDVDTTSSRTRGRASSTRVIRACEISLTLEGDCAGK